MGFLAANNSASTRPGQSNRTQKNTVSGGDEVSECESMEWEPTYKTVSFTGYCSIISSVIRGDMGPTDRKRRTNYSKVDTMFHRCRDGFQLLQDHAVHKGIMELNLVGLAVMPVWGKLVQELRMSVEGDWEGDVEWEISSKSEFRSIRQGFDPL